VEPFAAYLFCVFFSLTEPISHIKVVYDLPLAALNPEGQRESNTWVPALTFTKVQAYDFPHSGRYCAVFILFGEEQQGNDLSFSTLSNPTLLDNKTPRPNNFNVVGPYPNAHLIPQVVLVLC
jgi:hypothetical protein